jgi:hypothetical protein
VTRDIEKHTFNDKYRNGKAIFHEFRGKKAEDIVRYMNHHLEQEIPHTVVFVARGNDLSNNYLPMGRIEDIAGHLIEGGRVCRDQFGVQYGNQCTDF